VRADYAESELCNLTCQSDWTDSLWLYRTDTRVFNRR